MRAGCARMQSPVRRKLTDSSGLGIFRRAFHHRRPDQERRRVARKKLWPPLLSIGKWRQFYFPERPEYPGGVENADIHITQFGYIQSFAYVNSEPCRIRRYEASDAR